MKKIIYLLLLNFCLLPAYALAPLSPNDFASGSGTAADPFMIATAAHLDSVHKYLGPSRSKIYFKLANDIDLSGYASWRPIGYIPDSYNDQEEMFFGQFDGNGHVVRNMTIVTAGEYNNRRNAGLFGYVQATATIKNLGVENATITTNASGAGLICGSFAGKMENCYAIGKIKGTNASYLGGLVGYLKTLDNLQSSIIKYSYAIVDIENKQSANGMAFLGGIAGENSQGTISHCYTLVRLVCDRGYNVGGICGQVGTSSVQGRIEYCYSYGYVRGHSFVGGVNGYQYAGSALVGCYSAAQIIESPYTKDEQDPYRKLTFGGVMGGIYSTLEIVKESYYNTDIFSGRGLGVDASGLYGDGAKGLTTAEMKKSEKMMGSGWKYGIRWDIWEDHTTPFFLDELTPVEITTANPTYIEGVYKSTDAPTGIIIYNSKLEMLGEAVFNVSNHTWRVDLMVPASIDEYVYAIAIRGAKHSSPAFAKVNNTYFAGGDGSVANPFRITTPEHLQNVSYYMGSASSVTHFKVENDLDFSGLAPWVPIRGLESKEFCGTIDGKNFVLKNLAIVAPEQDTVGLFTSIGATGVVRNFKFWNSHVQGRDAVGTLCGANHGHITNCEVFGNVVANDTVGAICGVNTKLIDTCYTIATVNGRNAVGGFCGTNSGTLTMNYVYGTVIGTNVAGFCGGINAGLIATSFASTEMASTATKAGFCYNNAATVTACYFDKTKAGTESAVNTGDITGMTALSTGDMKKKANYKGWVLSSAVAEWNIWEGNTEPFIIKQTAPPVITLVNSTVVQGICQTSPAPDSIVVYRNYERAGVCIPGATSWKVDFTSNPIEITDVLFAVAYMAGKEPSRPAFVTDMANDATLKTLTVVGAELLPEFIPATLGYTIQPVANNVTQIVIAATATNSKATVSGAGTHSLKVGTNRLTVTVTSEDKLSKADYVITVVRKDANYIQSADASLKMLNLSNSGAASLISNFDPAALTYTVSVLHATDRVNIAATPNHAYATVSGTGSQQLQEGLNTFVVAVTAENQTATKNYTIEVTRHTATYTPSSEAGLQALALNAGTLTPSFNTTTYAYTANVSGSVEEINIMATPLHTGAKVMGAGWKKLAIGANVFVVDVTAEDGTTQHQYRVTINRSVPATVVLKNITVANMVIDCSVGTSFHYVADCGVTSANVAVEANDGTTVFINGHPQKNYVASLLANEPARITISLVSADQLTTKQYELLLLKPIPASALQLRWKTVLALSNAPEVNGGYYFQSYQWLQNGVEVAGATKPYVRINGAVSQYSVKTVTTDGYTISSCPLTNMSAHQTSTTPSVYPNPVQAGAMLNILADGTTNARYTVTVLNMQGRVEKSMVVSGEAASIAMPAQPGIYVVRITDESNVATTTNVVVY